MGDLRRPALASALLGAVLVLVSAVALAGQVDPMGSSPDGSATDALVDPPDPSTDGTPVNPGAVDPVPDDATAQGNASVGSHEAGTGPVPVSDQDVDEKVQVDDGVSVDEDRPAVGVDGVAGTGGVQAGAPGAAAGAWSVPDDVEATVGFSTDAGTGLVVGSPVAVEAPSGPAPPDGAADKEAPDVSVDVSILARDADDGPGRYGSNSEPFYGLDSLRPYRMTAIQGPTRTMVPAGGPGAVRPATGSGGAGSGAGGPTDGEARTATKTSGGFAGVLGVSDRTAAVTAAAATVIPALAYVLYHRIKGHEVLDNETRKAIYDEVCREPGLGVDELSDVADVSYSTASYHLDRLEEADMVVSSKRGKKICYFQNGGTFDEDERELLKVLRNEEAMRVFVDIMDHPGTYRARIADRLDVSTTTINWHLDALVEAGLVRENRDGRTAHLYVAQDRVDDHVLPLLDKTHHEDVDAPASVTRLRSRLQPAAKA